MSQDENQIETQKEEVATLKNLLSVSEKLLHMSAESIDYQVITDGMKELSGAWIVGLNTYEEGGTKSVTRAFSGFPPAIEQASKILGFPLTGKEWEVIPERVRSLQGGKLVQYNSLYETSLGAISKNTAQILERTFNIGYVYVIDFSYGERESLGDIIFFMKQGKKIKNREAIEVYADLIASILMRVRTEKALQESEAKFRSYMEKAPVGIFVANNAGRYIEVNRAACEMSGYTEEELLNLTIPDFTAPEFLDRGVKSFEKLKEEGYAEDEVMARKKNGEKFWINLVAIVIDSNRFIAFCQDITERKQAEEQIRYLSFHDQLTGLYNRYFLENEIKRLDTERQLPHSIIMADLNGLKLVNDTFGHEVGDEMLEQTAKILRDSCRWEDIIARWGGDEFVIFLPQTTRENANTICNRIDEQCEETYINDIPLSLALGSATKNSTEKALAETITEAEEYMYKQKLAKRQQINSAVLNTLLKNLEAKSFETEAHYLCMQDVAQKIGKKIGLSESELNRLEILIPMHDIGKINISEEILTKKGSLTAEEWEVMKKHPETGFRIARASEDFAHVAKEILSHHECSDGSGYPQGLKGKEIPLLARITAIADAYEVMSTGRPYKKAMSREEIIAEIKKDAGSQFDPELADVFLKILKKED
ncbi:MAG: diguanylate cyclase [Bacillota bacterium]